MIASHLGDMINNVAADGLAIEGSRESASMVLIYNSPGILIYMYMCIFSESTEQRSTHLRSLRMCMWCVPFGLVKLWWGQVKFWTNAWSEQHFIHEIRLQKSRSAVTEACYSNMCSWYPPCKDKSNAISLSLRICLWYIYNSLNITPYVIKWNHFPCYWPFVRGIYRSPVNSPHKGQWRGALMFSLICAWLTIVTPVIWDAIGLIITSL